MKKRASFIFISLLISGSFLMVQTSGCATSGGGGGGLFNTQGATWIFASWSGGAEGKPNDRTAQGPPLDTVPDRCLVDEVDLLFNGVDCGGTGDAFIGLNIANYCPATTTFYICLTKGSLTQPGDQLQECATDPLDTPFSQLRPVTLNEGCTGDFIAASAPLFINVFYCSPGQTLLTNPIECLDP